MGGQTPQESNSERRSWRERETPQAAWGWRKREKTQDAEAAWRFRLAGYALALAALLVFFFARLLIAPKTVPFRAMAWTGYSDPVPPNSYAQEDIERFQTTFSDRNVDYLGFVDRRDDVRSLKDSLRNLLEDMRPGGPKRRWRWSKRGAIVIYISAYGAVDERGRPCLLADAHDPLDSATWIPVSDVLSLITSTNTERLRDATKLVILDASQERENWRMGVLHNSFADRLGAVVQQARLTDPNLYVLNSARLSQQRLAAPEMAGSFFAYCVAAGLRGAADQAPRNGQVSLQELYDYVRREVDQFAYQYRGKRQQPLLIPEQVPAGAVLTFARSYEPPDVQPLDAKRLNDRHVALVDIWKQRDGLGHAHPGDQPVFAIDPVGWAGLDRQLVRLEQVLLAGKAYDFDAELATAKTLLDRIISRSPTIPRIENCSIDLAQRLQPLSEDDVAAAAVSLRQWLERKPDDKAASAEPPTQINGVAAAAATWKWLDSLGGRVDRDSLQKGLQFIERFDAPSGPSDVPGASGRPSEPPEVRLLRLLDGHLDWKSAASPVPRAIQAERAARATSAAEDARSHHWVHDTLDEADGQLRLSRDELFVGDTTALRNAEARWNRLIGDDGASGQYGEVADIKRKIAQAYLLRDEVCSKLPDLALWLIETEPTTEMDSVLSLIRQVHELGQTLNSVPGQVPRAAAAQTVESLRDSADQLFKRLTRGIDQRSDKLQVEDTMSSRDLHDVELLLRTSLVAGNARADLRRKYLKKLEERRMGDSLENHGPVPPDNSALSDPQIALSADTRTHPALELLDRTATAVEEPERTFDSLDLSSRTEEEQRAAKLLRLAEIGGKVRQRLSSLSAVADLLSKKTDALLVQPADLSYSAVRLDLSRADHLARCAAGLLAQPLAGDPCRRLVQLDTGYLILWHAERTILDFWGPEGGRQPAGVNGPETGPDYFSTAAEQYMAAVRQLSVRPRAYENKLREMASRLVSAADRWGTPSVHDIYVDPDNAFVEHTASLPRDPGLPSGTAAFEIQSQDGIELPEFEVPQQEAQRVLRRSFDPSQATESPLPFILQADDVLRAGASLTASCYYRGHLRGTEFSARPSVGLNMVFSTPKYGKPTVQVTADSKEISQVIFVLDCSYSMRAPTQFEGRNLDRLYVARKQLVSLLEKLRQTESDFRVGLILYGHRAGWDKNNKIRRKPAAPPDLHPGADVQRAISPPKPFDYRDVGGKQQSVINDVREATNDLEPWGETPLYFAISTALQSFDAGLAGPRHLVVITDGVDEQSPDVTPASTRTYSRDVKEVLGRGVRAQIDIILFSDKQDFERNKVQELKELAEDSRSGGRFYDAKNPGALLDSLLESLLKIKFTVHEEDGSRSAHEPRYLGDTWTVDDFDHEADYRVQILGDSTSALAEATIRLEGGEAIELEYDRMANRLAHTRYRQGERPTAQENVRGYYVSPHVPIPAGRDVTFRVSVQNQHADEFSPRPRHIWAEIRPLPDREPVYYVQDPLFEENVPVPVLRLECRNFPSDRAEVRLWFTFQQDVYWDASRLVKSADGKVHAGDATLQVNQGSPNTIVIVESHDADSQQYPLRVQVKPAADGILRSYMDKAKRVRHVFSYNTRPGKPQLLVGPQHDVDWIGIEPIEFQW